MNTPLIDSYGGCSLLVGIFRFWREHRNTLLRIGRVQIGPGPTILIPRLLRWCRISSIHRIPKPIAAFRPGCDASASGRRRLCPPRRRNAIRAASPISAPFLGGGVLGNPNPRRPLSSCQGEADLLISQCPGYVTESMANPLRTGSTSRCFWGQGACKSAAPSKSEGVPTCASNWHQRTRSMGFAILRRDSNPRCLAPFDRVSRLSKRTLFWIPLKGEPKTETHRFGGPTLTGCVDGPKSKLHICH